MKVERHTFCQKTLFRALIRRSDHHVAWWFPEWILPQVNQEIRSHVSNQEIKRRFFSWLIDLDVHSIERMINSVPFSIPSFLHWEIDSSCHITFHPSFCVPYTRLSLSFCLLIHWIQSSSRETHNNLAPSQSLYVFPHPCCGIRPAFLAILLLPLCRSSPSERANFPETIAILRQSKLWWLREQPETTRELEWR